MRFSIWLFSVLSICSTFSLFSQMANKSVLQLKEIMKGKEFIGYWPENVAWHPNGKSILFDWNPANETEMSKYKYSLIDKAITKVDPNSVHDNLEFDENQRNYETQYFLENGNLWRYNKSNDLCTEIIKTDSRIFNIQRLKDPNQICFQQSLNLFLYDSKIGSIRQLTFFKKGKENEQNEKKTELSEQQEELFKFIQEDLELEKFRENRKNNSEKSIYLDQRQIDYLEISKDGKYVFVRFGEYPENKNTTVQHHISNSGYSYTTNARSKVGENEPIHSFGIFDIEKDSLFFMKFDSLSSIRKKPKYLKEYGDTSSFYEANRKIIMHRPIQSDNGKVVLDIRSYDNKDRWIVQILPEKNDFIEIDNQHDEAWIGGPGISSWNMVSGTMGFHSNQEKLFFQSEKTGYSHLYSYDFSTKTISQLTGGNFEVHDVKLSQDKSTFYLTLNKNHPGNRELYKLESNSTKLKAVYSENGAIQSYFSPDEKYISYLFSDKINPWELYLMKNETNAVSTKITNSKSEAFKNYKWTDPEVVTFKGNDSIDVYARLFKASETDNKPAVIFVHGAGYLQNAHNYWSNYYREFMFHNLLKDNGFTVLDIDYRASEGYGRNYRTAIYRHMGGMDLNDQLSGKNFLVDNFNINPDKVGIYGGSYGGFITLMALFTMPEEFACGAALRSVTDWMHYNHEYTSNILNYPNTDSIAYRRSSPIYFAENLTNPLLILHGMVDDNVQFQDVVRLNQRLIELGKTNWELAVFPVEAHSFSKSYSWTDEYRRIFELFKTELDQE